VLAAAGWRVWLAYRDGEPRRRLLHLRRQDQLGIYWLATLLPHRSHGLGRAVMGAALGSSAERPAVLVATAAGEPLYCALGFQAITNAAWCRGPATGSRRRT
jgi:GNAT superfamily N-acetyltransferase